jgi:hypothetical protein
LKPFSFNPRDKTAITYSVAVLSIAGSKRGGAGERSPEMVQTPLPGDQSQRIIDPTTKARQSNWSDRSAFATKLRWISNTVSGNQFQDLSLFLTDRTVHGVSGHVAANTAVLH